MDKSETSPKIKVLLVEDDLVDQQAFQRLVRSQKLPYDFAIAGCVAEAHEILSSQRFDVVLADYLLGDGSAFDIFEPAGETPIIVITGSGNEEVAVNAMKLGAYDYLIKDLDRFYLKVLPLTVANTLKRKQAEEELRRFYRQLGQLVEARTQELAQANMALQDELRRSQDIEKSLARALVEAEAAHRAAEAAHQNVGVLLARASRDLDGLLQAILKFAQVLEDEVFGTLNQKQREYLVHLVTAARSAAGIIQEMLKGGTET